jgi:hypothetical protein
MDEREPLPRLIAHVAIVVAREGDERALAVIDQHLDPHEIVGASINDLNVKATRYVTDAFLSLPIPEEGRVVVARARKSVST